jgi:hypothetical protein
MFDGTSFKKIKRAKIGGERYRDKLTAIWFELMELAGRCNQGGRFISPRGIPYATIDDIAIQIDRETDELDLCMQFFINEGMVEIINDIYGLTNWHEYQSEAALDVIREKTRQRVAKHRENKQKQLQEIVQDEQCNVTVTLPERYQGVTEALPSYIEKEEDKEKEILSISLARARAKADVDNFVDDEDEAIRAELRARQRNYFFGELGEGLIFMSEEQWANLLEVYSLDEIHYYFEVIKEQIRKGRRYRKTHYQAFIDMAEKDRKTR